MIVDLLENHPFYSQIGRLAKAFGHLQKMLAGQPGDGRYPLEGEEIYALVRSYLTGDPAAKRLETHRRYIDLQYMVRGSEDIFWSPLPGPAPLGVYDGEKDLLFHLDPPCLSRICLAEGQFAIFHPGDAHKPECAPGAPVEVRKIVLKIRVD